MKTFIANTWKTIEGKTIHDKAVGLIKRLGFKYEKIDLRSNKEYRGATNGNFIAFSRVYDKLDLFTVFHELGHAFIHKFDDVNEYWENQNLKNKQENEANKFAWDVMVAIYGDSDKLRTLFRIYVNF